MSIAPGKIYGLYIISDTSVSRGRSHEEVVAAALTGGARVVQLREKWMGVRELYPVALRIRELTRQAGAAFIVNDMIDLAMAVGADGVHIGQDDMPATAARKILGPYMVIGVSTHSIQEAYAAVRDGADYIGYGPMFATGTKDAGEPKGPEGLREIRAKIELPIAAIGGINADNAASVIDAGADALAVISAVSGSDDMAAAAKAISALFDIRG